jgi:hypothetical protein
MTELLGAYMTDYHKQNQNSKIPNLHLKTLKIILNKIYNCLYAKY